MELKILRVQSFYVNALIASIFSFSNRQIVFPFIFPFI
ncbi:putative membrane protein [Acinetobacter baumannii 25569_7]|nr:putative membrane protein [Acinetobacter baumannii 25569_7]